MLAKVAASSAVSVLTVLATLALLPFSLRYLGTQTYGTWLMIQALAAYAWLLNLGVAGAMQRQLTVSFAENDEVGERRVLTTLMVTVLALSLAALATYPILAWALERNLSGAPELIAEARFCLLLALINSVLLIAADIPLVIFSARQDFLSLNAIRSVMIVLKLAGAVFAIVRWPTLQTMGWILLIGALVDILALVVATIWRFPALVLRPGRFSYASFRQGMREGLLMFLVPASSQVMLQTLTLLVGARLGSAVAVQYNVPTGVVLQIIGFMTAAIAAVIMPFSTELAARGHHEARLTLFYRWSKIAFAITAAAVAVLVVLGPELFIVWLGPGMSQAGRVLQISVVSLLLFLPMSVTAVPMMMGAGQIAVPTIAILVANLATPVLAIAVIDAFSVEGVAAAGTICRTAVAMVIIGIATRAFGLPAGLFFIETFGKGLVGLAVVLAFGYVLELWVAPTTFFGLAMAGSAMGLVFAAVWYGYVLRGDPHVVLPSPADFKKQICRLRSERT